MRWRGGTAHSPHIQPGSGPVPPQAAADVHTARGEAPGDGLVTMPDGTQFAARDARDVASAVVWLCQSGRYLNGAVVPLDGGKSRY